MATMQGGVFWWLRPCPTSLQARVRGRRREGVQLEAILPCPLAPAVRAFTASGLGPSQPFPLSIHPARGCGTTGWTIKGPSQALVLVGKSCLQATPCLKGQRGKGLCAPGVQKLPPPTVRKAPGWPLSVAKQFWVIRKRQKSSCQRARHPGRWDGQKLR